MSTPGKAPVYTQGFGSSFENVEIPYISNRAPTAYDINYPVGKTWIDTLAQTIYVLTSFNSAGGAITANWVNTASAYSVLSTITSGDSTVVSPALNNINVVGTSNVKTTGAGSTVTVSIDPPVTVANGGTGAITLTDHGVLIGSGTGAVTPLAAAATGACLMGATGADPAFTGSPHFSGTISVDNGVTINDGPLYLISGTFKMVHDTLGSSAGTSTLTAGHDTVITTAIHTDSTVYLTVNKLGTVTAPKAVYATNIVDGLSFDIVSADATDTSDVAWLIIT